MDPLFEPIFDPIENQMGFPCKLNFGINLNVSLVPFSRPLTPREEMLRQGPDVEDSVLLLYITIL